MLLNYINIHLTTYVELEYLHPMCYVYLKCCLDFRAYFEDVYYIAEPYSNYVSRKQKCKDKEEEMQDRRTRL